MIRNKIVFAALIVLSFSWTGCKKDTNTNEIRLNAVTYFDGVNLTTTSMQYDQLGRIIKVSVKGSGWPEYTLFGISYKGNEIVMTRMVNNDSTMVFDSVSLIVNAANLAQKKISNEYIEIKPFPGVPPQKIFFRDTTLYEYDVNGLLKSESSHHYDSNWVNFFGRISADAWLTTEVTTYVNNNKNLSSYSTTSDETHYFHEYGSTSVETTSSKEDWSFDYGNSYPNNTDFKNAGVLNQIRCWVVYPMNKNYRNLPGRYTLTRTLTDTNGITTRQSSGGEYILKYNSYGLLVSEGDPARTNFIYSR